MLSELLAVLLPLLEYRWLIICFLCFFTVYPLGSVTWGSVSHGTAIGPVSVLSSARTALLTENRGKKTDGGKRSFSVCLPNLCT